MSDTSEKDFLAALGSLVVAWNFAEGWIRTLLLRLSGDTKISQILTHELGSVGIENALLAIANHSLETEPAKRVKYLVSLYSILRGYRNYWIHSTIFVGGAEAQSAHGYTYSVSAKGKLQTHSQIVETENIQKIRESCLYLGLFARAVAMNFSQEKDIRDGEIPALPDMQPLPPEVDKNSPYPQWQKQPNPPERAKQSKKKASSRA